MSRENAQAKGRRYITEGRLIVTVATEHAVSAICRGGGAVYRVAFDGGRWSCNCPARSLCAHLVALQLVTAPRGRS